MNDADRATEAWAGQTAAPGPCCGADQGVPRACSSETDAGAGMARDKAAKAAEMSGGFFTESDWVPANLVGARAREVASC